MKIKKLLGLTLIASVFFTACSSDDDASETPLGDYDNGVIILNQGNYNSTNASVSFLSNNLSVQQNNIFSLVNPSITLGDTGQDIGFHNNLAYIVVNNSHKIEIVNRYSFEHVATISSGLNNPRYIAFTNGKAYVTNWGDASNPNDDFVAVINLNNHSVSSTITVVEGPERIIEENGKLYVSHKGGWNQGSQVSVINASNNTVATTITVGDLPDTIAIKNGILYVLCEGKGAWTNNETGGKLVKINLSNNSITATLNFATNEHPSHLQIENNAIYYVLENDIFKTSLEAASLPSSPLFSTTSQNVFAINSLALQNNTFYVGDALDFNSNGKVHVYTATGVFKNTFTVGIIPSGFYFNN